MPTRLSIKILGCLIYIFILPYTILSQNRSDDFPFKNIEYFNSANGLTGQSVFQVMQDRQGFIWMTTNYGMNRYDGYNFRFWGSDPDNPNSLATNSAWYSGMTEDKEGVLWLSHETSGIYSYDKRVDTFTHYTHEPGNKNSLLSNHVNGISAHADGSVWIVTSKGLQKLDRNSNTFTSFNHKINDNTFISSDTIMAIIAGTKNVQGLAENNFWLVNNRLGLDCFDTKTGKRTMHFDFPFKIKEGSSFGYSNLRINSLKNGNIWYGSDDKGIYGFNCDRKEFIHIKMNRPCQSAGHVDVGFYQVLEDDAGNLWTVNDNNELVYYDRARQAFYFHPIDRQKARFLDLTVTLLEDANKNIWLGTEKALLRISTKKNPFTDIRQTDEQTIALSGNHFFDIFRTSNGQLLAGAVPLMELNKESNSVKVIRLPLDAKNLNVYAVRKINEDNDGHLWLTGDFGMVYNNKKNRQWKKLELTENSQPIKTDVYRGVFQDKKGVHWALNAASGFYSFDPETGKAIQFADKTLLGTNCGCKSPFLDSRGIFYLGLGNNGFATFNTETAKYKLFRHNTGKANAISDENVTGFVESKDGLIWFSTLGKGLGVFDPSTEKFKFFSTKDGLINNAVYSLVTDNRGIIWAGTQSGISSFRPSEKIFSDDEKISFANYGPKDGVPDNSCNFYAAFCDNDGTLFFGTQGGGVFYFHPDSLKENGFIPPVHITDLSINHKPVSVNNINSVLPSTIEFTKEMKLNYRQNILSFSFTSLNYIHPEKNQYAYMLEGYDEEWIYTDATKRFATYTNLKPSKYIFKVRGSNNDGKWNETPTELKIIITPPFWQTAWFRILLALTVAAMIFSFYRYRIGQIMLLQRIRNKIAADLHDDIGSTLNSISIYSEVAKKDEARRDHALTMIGESSRKIVDSISDIVWAINPQNDSFDKIIFRMKSLTYHLLKAKKIECTFKSDEELSKINLSMEIRKNFYLIFKEALNNLVKYSEASRASVLVAYEGRNISFIIRDNGIGFNSNSANYGNGINNMKRRAVEIKGELKIESEPGKGTSVQLNLKT